jgi:hypothetical protein
MYLFVPSFIYYIAFYSFIRASLFNSTLFILFIDLIILERLISKRFCLRKWVCGEVRFCLHVGLRKLNSQVAAFLTDWFFPLHARLS